jgi:hypothetical protein
LNENVVMFPQVPVSVKRRPRRGLEAIAVIVTILACALISSTVAGSFNSLSNQSAGCSAQIDGLRAGLCR